MNNLRMTTSRKATPEELLALVPELPVPIIPKNVDKTLKVKLTRGYVTHCKTTTGKTKLFMAQVVTLPYAEARALVEKGGATLMFDDDGGVEEAKDAKQK